MGMLVYKHFLLLVPFAQWLYPISVKIKVIIVSVGVENQIKANNYVTLQGVR